MGLVKGSATITRYKVEGELPPGGAEFIDQGIRSHVFVDIEETTDELAVGWVSAADFLDTTFTFASYSLEPYVVLGFRVDRRKVQAATLRKYQRIEEARFMAARDDGGGGYRLGRAQREQLKERARLGLLTRIPPASSVYDLVWDTSRSEVWVGTSTRAVLDLVEDHFRESFKLQLVPRIPFHLAGDLLKPAEREALETARPLDL